MKLEDQVCSLELAKKLKELGVKQESLFVWIQRKPESANEEPHWYVKQEGNWPAGMKLYDSNSAFTVAELGEMLKGYGYATSQTIPFADENKWYCFVYEEDITDWDDFADTEADARAKMLCYLIENGLFKE